MSHSHKFPLETDADVYIVMVDWGRDGLAWEETPVESQGRDGCIEHLRGLSDEMIVKRVVRFNIAEGRCEDVTQDILAAAGWFDEPDDDDAGSDFDRAASCGDRIYQQQQEGVR